jgi:hypothetical protein
MSKWHYISRTLRSLSWHPPLFPLGRLVTHNTVSHLCILLGVWHKVQVSIKRIRVELSQVPRMPRQLHPTEFCQPVDYCTVCPGYGQADRQKSTNPWISWSFGHGLLGFCSVLRTISWVMLGMGTWHTDPWVDGFLSGVTDYIQGQKMP